MKKYIIDGLTIKDSNNRIVCEFITYEDKKSIKWRNSNMKLICNLLNNNINETSMFCEVGKLPNETCYMRNSENNCDNCPHNIK